MSRHVSGFMAWLIQRVSAIYLALFTLYAFFYLLFFTPQDYSHWHAWVLSTPVMLGVLVMVFFTLLHAWIGIRDVLIDYIPFTGLRLVFLSVVATTLIACGFWASLIMLTARIG